MTSRHHCLTSLFPLVATLLPVIAEALLDTIVLLLTRSIRVVLAVNDTLLALLTLNVEIGAEFDRGGAALGELVQLRLLGDGRGVFFLVLAAGERTLPNDGVGDLSRVVLLMRLNERMAACCKGETYLIITSLVRELERRLHALLKIIRRNDPRSILVQTKPVVIRRHLRIKILELLVRDLGLAPRVVFVVQADAKVRVCDIPVVDLRPIYGVGAEGQTRSSLVTIRGSKVRAAWALEGLDIVFPVQRKNAVASGFRSGQGGDEASEAEGGCENGLHHKEY